MTSPMTVFLTGIFGVFLGMAFLYLSVKATGAVAMALENKAAAKEEG
jgi:hypothetical protein